MGKFVPSPTFQLSVDLAVKPDLLARSRTMIAVAADSNNDDTGAYDDSLRTFDDERGVGGETTDFAGHIIEYGSEGQPAQAPLRTGAMSVGRFDPAAKP